MRSQSSVALPIERFRDEQTRLIKSIPPISRSGASIFSRDLDARSHLAARIKTGFVLINDLIVPTADPRMPFGGVKASGFGSTRGDEGLLEMTFPHVVGDAPRKLTPAFRRERSRRCASFFLPTSGRRMDAVGSAFGAIRDFVGALLRQNQKQKNKLMKPIGIIGGGLGGLSAACVLAARGHKVTFSNATTGSAAKRLSCAATVFVSTWDRPS